MIDTTKDTVIVASGFWTQLYLWLDKANLILSVAVGVFTCMYSVLRLYDYMKYRRKKNV